MKKYAFNILIAFGFLLAGGFMAPVLAQSILENLNNLNPKEEVVSDEGEEPPLDLPAIPEAEEKQAAPTMPTVQEDPNGYFPDLPPSRLCKPKDLIGVWKLGMVFESPTGNEISDFSTYPSQYFWFRKDTVFKRFKAASESSQADVLYKMKTKLGGPVEQFVMHESGILYFYKDSVAVDSLACFIVTNPVEPFEAGSMLLMLPPDKATTRMVRIYKKVFGPPKPNQQQLKKNQRKRKPGNQRWRR